MDLTRGEGGPISLAPFLKGLSIETEMVIGGIAGQIVSDLDNF